MDNAAFLTLAELSVGDYAPIRNAFKMEIQGAIIEYLLTENVRVTRFRNQYKQAVSQAFGDAFELGYKDGGGDANQYDPDDQAWLNAAQQGEWGYVDMLFDQMRQLKKDGATKPEMQSFADDRAEGYAKTLDGVYSQGKIRGAGNIMLTFGGPDGNETCPTCQSLKGKRHKASWWVARGLTVFRGNQNFKCGCWNCQHGLFDDNGNLYNI